MFNVLVLQPNADPLNDVYGFDIDFTAPDIADLKVGAVVVAKSDGSLIENAVDPATDIALTAGQHINFVVNTINGLKKSVDLKRGGIRYTKEEHLTPEAKEIEVTIAAPADLTPFVGQYASITFTNKMIPEFNQTRLKFVSVELTEDNVVSIDDVMDDLVDAINHTIPYVTAVYALGVLTLTGEAGFDFAISAGDIIRDSAIEVTIPVVFGTPNAALVKRIQELSSYDGVNISKQASELYSLSPEINPTLAYSRYVINIINPIGPSKVPSFTLTQYIFVPEGMANVDADIQAVLDYLMGNDTAAWA